jgi:hypothetical protein
MQFIVVMKIVKQQCASFHLAIKILQMPQVFFDVQIFKHYELPKDISSLESLKFTKTTFCELFGK